MKNLCSLLSLTNKPLDMQELGYIYPQSDINIVQEKVDKIYTDKAKYEAVLSKVVDFVADFPLLTDQERYEYRQAQKYNSRLMAGIGPLEARLRWMKASHELDMKQPDKDLILQFSIKRNIQPAQAANEIDVNLDVVFYPPYIVERAKYMLNRYRTFTWAGEPVWENAESIGGDDISGSPAHRMKWMDKAAQEEDRLFGLGKTPIMDLVTKRKKFWKKLKDFVNKYEKSYIQDSMQMSAGKPTSTLSPAKLQEIYDSEAVEKDVITNVPISDFSGFIARMNQEDIIKYQMIKDNQDEFGFIFTTMALVGTFLISTLPAFIVSFLAAPFAVLVATFPALGPVMAMVPTALMPALTLLGKSAAAAAVAKILPKGVRKAINVLAPVAGGDFSDIDVGQAIADAPEAIVKATSDGLVTVAKTVTTAPSISAPTVTMSAPKISTPTTTMSAPKISTPTTTLSSPTISKETIGDKIENEAERALNREIDKLKAEKAKFLATLTPENARKWLLAEAKRRLALALAPKQYPTINSDGQLVATKDPLAVADKVVEGPKKSGMGNLLLIGAAVAAGAMVLS